MRDPGSPPPWWAAWPTRYPRATLLAAGLIAALAALMVTRLRPTASLAAMFPERHASARAMARVAENFAATDSLLVLVTAKEGGRERGLVAFAERLEQELAGEEARRLIRVMQYRPSPQFRRYVEEVVAPSLVDYLDEEGLRELRRRLTREGIEEQVGRNEAMVAAGGAGGMMQTLLRDPLRLSEIVLKTVAPSGGPFAHMAGDSAQLSPDGRSLLIQVAPTRPVGDMDAVAKLMDLVRSAVGRARPGDLDVDYAGGYAIAEAAQRSIRSDMIRSVTGSVVLLQLLFLLTYRNLWSFPLAFVPVAWGILVAFGVAAAVTPDISPPIAVIGAILAGLGIDYCVHFLSHYHAARGADRAAGVSRAIGPAMLGACTTSVIAFGAVMFSDIPALRSFAMIGIVGLGASLIGTMAILPAFFTLSAWRDGGVWLWWSGAPIVRFIDGHARACMGIVAGLFVAACLVTLTGWEGSVVEPDLNAMHPQPNAPLMTQSAIAERFNTSADPLLVHVQGASPEDLLTRTHEVRRRLERGAEMGEHVVGTFGPGNLLPDPSGAETRKAAVAGIEADRVVDDFTEVIGQSVFDPLPFVPYQAFLRSALRPGPPPGVERLRAYPDIASQVLGREGAVHEAITFVFLRHPLEDRSVRHQTVEAVRAALHGLEGVTLTGMTVVAHDAERSIIADVSRLLGVAMGVVVVWLLVQFRNLRDGALALLPVAAGAAAVGVAATAGGLRLNMVNLIALPLLMGLGVDYGIFLVSTARSVRAVGGGPGELRAAIASSMHAIIVAAGTTALSFGSLMFTSVPAIRSLGELLAVGITACLGATLLGLLPLLLRPHPEGSGR